MYPIRFISRADLQHAAETLEVSVEIIKAVARVEAGRAGFIKGTDQPTILFEGHVFHRLTDGVHAQALPGISHPKWTKAHYRGGIGEYERLRTAIAAHSGDPEPALKSASWGMFQIMGFNHAQAGYDSVVDYVNDIATGEDAQLGAFIRFIRNTPELARALRSQDWRDFARRYNGAGFERNAYDVRLASEFQTAVLRLQEEKLGGAMDLERGDAMKLQLALNLALEGTEALEAPLAVDGWIGAKTRRAALAARRLLGVQGDAPIDAALCEALGVDLAAYDLAEEF